MSNKDLSDFFKKYITNYTVGTDDTVSKYVGDQDKQVSPTDQPTSHLNALLPCILSGTPILDASATVFSEHLLVSGRAD